MGAGKSILPRRQLAKNVTTKADEDNAVPGWIAAAPFDFSVGHCDPRTSLNMLGSARGRALFY